MTGQLTNGNGQQDKKSTLDVVYALFEVFCRNWNRFRALSRPLKDWRGRQRKGFEMDTRFGDWLDRRPMTDWQDSLLHARVHRSVRKGKKGSFPSSLGSCKFTHPWHPFPITMLLSSVLRPPYFFKISSVLSLPELFHNVPRSDYVGENGLIVCKLTIICSTS